MAIRSKNLNLLPLLQALLEEKSVVAAADKIGLSQPAMSAALANLRQAFDDPILVRVGRTMHPTPRALELQDQLNDVCAQIDVLFQPDSFDPKTAKTLFRVAAPSYISFLLADKWIARLATAAPNIKIDFVDIPIELSHWLDNSTVDVAIARPIEVWEGQQMLSKKLFEDRAVVLVSEKHPFYSKDEVSPDELKKNLTIEFNLNANYPYISKTRSSTFDFTGFEQNSQLSCMSEFNAIALATQHPIFALAPYSLAAYLSTIFSLKVLEISNSETSYSTDMIWSARTDKSLPHMWLRDEIKKAAKLIKNAL